MKKGYRLKQHPCKIYLPVSRFEAAESFPADERPISFYCLWQDHLSYRHHFVVLNLFYVSRIRAFQTIQEAINAKCSFPLLIHAHYAFFKNRLIVLYKTFISRGFAICASIPARLHSSLSSTNALAVMARIGI